MVKIEGNEKRPCWKRDIDSEYPKWVDYKFQDAKFFEDVRKLSAEGLDPKGEITDEHVTTADITYIFGNVSKFRTTNPLLSEDHKKQLEKLYWKIYGTGHITNNELYIWLVRGWIVEGKRHKVNWAAIAAVATAPEKAQRQSSGSLPKAHTTEISECSFGSERPEGFDLPNTRDLVLP
jgi:hypothetical protein